MMISQAKTREKTVTIQIHGRGVLSPFPDRALASGLAELSSTTKNSYHHAHGNILHLRFQSLQRHFVQGLYHQA